MLTAILLAASVGLQTQAAGKELTPADVAPFVGEWTLALQGPNGPGTFDVSIRVEKDKPVGDIANDAVPKQPLTSFAMAEKSLTVGYSFTWEGNPVDALVTLTPATEGPLKARIDFANGAYVMEGTATKKEKAK